MHIESLDKLRLDSEGSTWVQYSTTVLHYDSTTNLYCTPYVPFALYRASGKGMTEEPITCLLLVLLNG